MNHRYKLLAAAMLLAGSAGAQAQIYKGTLSGAQEVPAVTTNGTGTGVVSLNTATHQMRVRTTFSGLTGTTTASHVHCCTAPGANAGVATQTPSFTGFPAGVTSGSYDAVFDMTQATSWNAAFITANGGTPASAEATLATALEGGRAYLNIHSTTSAGGEIRGNLTRFSFVNGATRRTIGIAYALDSLGAGTGIVNDRLVSIAMLPTAQQSAAMEALVPLSDGVVAATQTTSLYADYDQISNRLAGLRADTGNGLWLRYADRRNELELGARGAAAESDGWDVGIGLDWRLASGLVVGAAYTYTEDSLDYGGTLSGSGNELEGWRGTVYAEQRFASFFIEGMASVGGSESDTVRSLGGAPGLATGNGDTDQWGARVGLGFDLLHDSGLRFTPQVRMDWSGVDSDGYEESGGGGFALDVEGSGVDSWRASVGGQLDWTGSGMLRPFARAFWSEELEDGNVITVATLAGSNLAFEMLDERLVDSGYTAGVGLNFAGGEAFSASLSYDMSDYDEFESDVFQARALWRF